MNLAPDKIKHLKSGLLVAAYLGCLMLLASAHWYGSAISLGATAALIGVELYQKQHDKGTPEWADVWAGSVPSWVLGALVGWLA